METPAALPPSLTSLFHIQGTREVKHRQCPPWTCAVSYQTMNWQLGYLKEDLVLWLWPNDNCINTAEVLLRGLMFYLGFLRPFSSVTQALVLHVLRNTCTQRMFRQSACGKFSFLFLLFVINLTKPNCIDFTRGKIACCYPSNAT